MMLLSSCVRRTGACSDTALLPVRELRVFLCGSLGRFYNNCILDHTSKY